MGYYDPDPYYQPEKFGLVKAAEAELSEPCYSFDTAVVWYHAESRSFYAGQDSGCSCPSPFEYVHKLEELSGPYDKIGALRFLSQYTSEDPQELAKAAEAVMTFQPPEVTN
ncbi:DUF7574 domain-containing protein [Actinoplanes sp. CA-054009]